ncbi:MAG: hypothetical protein CMB80_20995, partial [Flammeovirgaceae bacterium]|nr:hypothetical protein [Flammeovirgaceae bacterium]
MPVIKNEFRLTRSYIDEFKNRYSPLDLVLWLRMTRNQPENLSSSDVEAIYDTLYDADREARNSRIGYNVYPAIFLTSQTHENPKCSSVTGQLSMSTLPDDGTPTADSDIPFSISAWVKFDIDGVRRMILEKRGSLGAGFSYSFSIQGSNTIRFVLSDLVDTGTAEIESDTICTVANMGGEWHHYVATYDGRGGNAAAAGLNLYVDGALLTNVTRTDTGNYLGMQPEWDVARMLMIGSLGTGGTPTTSDMAEIAIWRRELSQEDVTAVYNGTISRVEFSGFLNNPPRTVLSSRDSATGSYPTILRTTGRTTTLGNTPSAYDDTRAIIYRDANDVHYPTVLETVDNNKYASDWIATPNAYIDGPGIFGTGSIVAPGSVRPFVSDQGLKFSIDQRGVGSPRHNFEPFDESRIYLEETQFYLTGTNPKIYPGFTSPLDDKIQIKIPISSKEEAIASRFAWNSLVGDFGSSRLDEPSEARVRGQGTEFFEKNHTGFLYYNKDNKKWEEQGITDYATQEDNNYMMFELVSQGVQIDDPGEQWYFFPDSPWVARHTTLQGNFSKIYRTYQFSQSTNVGFSARTYDDLLSMGYHTIGAPTMQGMAPFSRTYHATSSCTFKMSDYIAHPFLLEKAVIDIPILIRRKNGNSYSGLNTWPGISAGSIGLPVDSSLRDIDNYVFFLYRQARAGNTDGIDTVYDCNNTKRYLICSGSVAAYNPLVFNQSVRDEIDIRGLPHNPAVSIKLRRLVGTFEGGVYEDLPVSGADGDGNSPYAQGLEGLFRGSIRIEMTPAVPSAQFLGGSRAPVRGWDQFGAVPGTEVGVAASNIGTIVIQDYWAGGTTFPSMSFKADPSDTAGANAGQSNQLSNVQRGCKWPYPDTLYSSPSTLGGDDTFPGKIPRNDNELQWAPGLMFTGTRFLPPTGSSLVPRLPGKNASPLFQMVGKNTSIRSRNKDYFNSVNWSLTKPYPLRNEIRYRKMPVESHQTFLEGFTTAGTGSGADNNPYGPTPLIPPGEDPRPIRNPIGLISPAESIESIESQVRFGLDFGDRGVVAFTEDCFQTTDINDGDEMTIRIFGKTGGPLSYFSLNKYGNLDTQTREDDPYAEVILHMVGNASAMPADDSLVDNKVYIRRGSANPLIDADRIIQAINGNGIKQVYIKYGFIAGDYIVGIPGISAVIGTNNDKISIMAQYATGRPGILSGSATQVWGGKRRINEVAMGYSDEWPDTSAGHVRRAIEWHLPGGSNQVPVYRQGSTGSSYNPGAYRNVPIVFGTKPISTPSPYVLMPGDDIVIGLDAGIAAVPCSGSWYDNGLVPGTLGMDSSSPTGSWSKQYVSPPGIARSGSLCEISGSFLKLLTGEASLTLFGSMISNNKEKLFELNQNLTSDAIHEALHFDNPVVDEFSIATRSQLEGSYTSDLVLGNIGGDLSYNRFKLGSLLTTKAEYGTPMMATPEALQALQVISGGIGRGRASSFAIGTNRMSAIIDPNRDILTSSYYISTDWTSLNVLSSSDGKTITTLLTNPKDTMGEYIKYYTFPLSGAKPSDPLGGRY